MDAFVAAAPDNRLVRCPLPSHGKGQGDRNPSLSIRRTAEGRLLVHCFAGCDPTEVLAALGERAERNCSAQMPNNSAHSHEHYSSPALAPLRRVPHTRARNSAHSDHPLRGEHYEHYSGSTEWALVWELAQGRARDDEAVAADAEVWGFLRARHLVLAWEEGAFGILPPEERRLPAPLRPWPRKGFRLVAPLWSVRDGSLVALQGRRVRQGDPKTLFPKGARVGGSCFANGAGRAVLTSHEGTEPVLVLEGMTDFLALVGHVGEALALLAVPGVGMVRSLAGQWARGRRVFVAFDQDEPGQRAAREELAPALADWGADVIALKGWDGKDVAQGLERDPDLAGELVGAVR